MLENLANVPGLKAGVRAAAFGARPRGRLLAEAPDATNGVANRGFRRHGSAKMRLMRRSITPAVSACVLLALGTQACGAADVSARPAAAAHRTILPPRCTPGSLTLRRIHSATGSNQVSLTLSFRNRGSRSCFLQGWPLVEGQTTSGAGRRAADGFIKRGHRTPVVVLQPGGSNDAFVIGGSDLPPNGRSSCGSDFRYLLIGAPHSRSFVRFSAWVPYGHEYFPPCKGGPAVSPILPRAAAANYQ